MDTLGENSRQLKNNSTCIDVELRFPGYVVGYDDPEFALTKDPWHKVIVGKFGHISPAGDDKLWVCTSSTGTDVARMILNQELPCEIRMEGDDGINAEFDVKDSHIFLKAIGAKRK